MNRTQRRQLPKKLAKGYVAYEGPSRNDGKPNVVIVTMHTTNIKTGPMPTAWIIRSDIHPQEAVKTGEDFSICGNCHLRPEMVEKLKALGVDNPPSCYVAVFQAPTQIYKAYHRGVYVRVSLDELAEILRGRTLRIGGYGDGAVVPVAVWERLLQFVTRHTAYTHGWTMPNFDASFLKIAMVSVDPFSVAEYAAEFAALPTTGRKFRMLEDGETPKVDEVLCPNFTHKTQCIDCGLCAGVSVQAKHVVAHDHGPRSAYRNAQVAAKKAARLAA